MSKKITMRYQCRRPSDSVRYLQMIASACPQDVDLDATIDCAPAAKQRSQTQRVDERLETVVSGSVGRELDRLDALAQAVKDHKVAESLRAMQDRAEQYVEHRRTIREWFAETAKAGWSATVKVVTEVLLKSGGSGG